MPFPLHLPDLAATERLAASLAALAHPGDAILLEGPLGAGKTALARAFLRAATGDPALEVPSPSFTLVQTYETPLGPVHHFDLWRLDGPAGLTELGWEAALDDIVLVEWPDRLGPLRPPDALTICLQPGENNARRATLHGWPERIRADRMSRQTISAEFLARHGYSLDRAVPLAQDASFRRYLRLTDGPRPALLMDAPAPEDTRPFLHIAAHLHALGVSAPEIIAADTQVGLILEEDLGDDLFATLISPATIEPLFQEAVALLVAIQRASPPSGLPAWDAAAMVQATLGPLFDWWWPAAFRSSPPEAARRDFAAALEAMLAPVAAAPTCFVHRDFFAGNLIWLPERTGLRRVGLIDFQGAAIGHPAYDLVSLLQDARRDIPPVLAEHSLTGYLAARPELEPASFRTAFAACAAQRHLRVAAQWVRLAQRDGRPHYLAYGPRTWRVLEQALREPPAAPLALAMDRWIPSDMRANPAALAA